MTRDLATGFFQVELPAHLRNLFVFNTEMGIIRLKRLPMGLSLAVEVMEIVILALTDVPNENVVMKTFVDGLRCTGTRDAVEDVMRRVDARAFEAGATWKEITPFSRLYTWLGVIHDHNEHTVAVGKKTISKIPEEAPHSPQFREWEALIGRLLFGSSV